MSNPNSREMKSSTRDNLEGAARRVAGRVKEGAGRAVGNPRLEAQGRLDQLDGAVQQKLGQIKKVFGR
jgi:uncharacterized protein YjbJ (UPF0337 family)